MEKLTDKVLFANKVHAFTNKLYVESLLSTPILFTNKVYRWRSLQTKSTQYYLQIKYIDGEICKQSMRSIIYKQSIYTNIIYKQSI